MVAPMSLAAVQAIAPYYDRDGITVYNAKWEAIVAAGLVPVREVALIHADPPYGINEPGDRRSRGGRKGEGRKGWPSRHWPQISGDDRPYDPSPVLALDRPTVLWGANHYTDKLPPSAAWIVWDKRDAVLENNNSDAEIAWCNFGGSVRLFHHLWAGLVRASESGEAVLHQTQKPIALSTYVFQRAKLKRGDLVLVPYLGSGPDLPAAQAMGLRLIGCDVEEWCCRTAVARLGAAPHPEPHATLGPLFASV